MDPLGIFGTRWVSLTNPVGARFKCDWVRFVQRCADPVITNDKASLARWSPAYFSGNHRAGANVLRVSAVVYDFDKGETSFDSIMRAFPHYHLAHTTHSHTADAPRIRVVYPITRSVTSEEYKRVWRYGAVRLEAASLEVDAVARDPSRAWAVPGARSLSEYSLRIAGGPLLDVQMALDEVPEETPVEWDPVDRDRSPDVIMRATRWLEVVPPSISGSGGHVALFNAAVGLVVGFCLDDADALQLLETYFNPRCQPAWSSWDLKRKVKQASRSHRQPGYLRDAKRM